METTSVETRRYSIRAFNARNDLKKKKKVTDFTVMPDPFIDSREK